MAETSQGRGWKHAEKEQYERIRISEFKIRISDFGEFLGGRCHKL